MQVHVINLKRRPDRINRVTERFENIGVSIAPHLAFDVNSCPPESNLQLVPNGLLANWRSHESLLAQIADSEDLYSLILEDDAVPETKVDWNLLLENTPSAMSGAGLDFLQLGFVSWQFGMTRPGAMERMRLLLYPRTTSIIQLDTKRKVVRASVLSGAHAYVVSRRFARQIEAINSPCWTGSDGLYMRLASMSGADEIFPHMARLKRSIVEQESRISRSSSLDSNVS